MRSQTPPAEGTGTDPTPSEDVHNPHRGGSAVIQAVLRAGDILALFGPHRERITAQEAGQLVGLNRTTAHRYLISLEQVGLLDRDGAHYEPGPVALQLGAMGLAQKKVSRVAPSFMRELREQVRLTIALAVWGPGGPVVIDVEEDHSRELLLTVAVGTQLDLFAGHTAAWLGFGVDEMRKNRLLSTLPPTDRESLERKIALTRQTGLGVRVSPENGFAAVAAPIFDARRMCASIAMLGTPIIMEPVDGPLAAALQRCARAITKELDGHYPDNLPG